MLKIVYIFKYFIIEKYILQKYLKINKFKYKFIFSYS